ncbi:MAG: hypothetical protein R2845_05210 [Thermomicrobiales bacterium]
MVAHNDGQYLVVAQAGVVKMSFANVRACFSPDPDLIYLRCGDHGLAPNATIAALEGALQGGKAGAPTGSMIGRCTAKQLAVRSPN